MGRGADDRPGAGFAVRAPRPGELAEARALMLRIIERDYGYGYDPRWHYDLDDLRGFYLEHPRQALFVAVDDATGRLAGTAAIKAPRLTAPPHPPAIVARYDPTRTAELTRVFVAPAYRRRGLARTLVDAARRWVAAAGGFDVITLHSASAVEFWRALPATEVLDARRPGATGPLGGSVYFELAVPPRAGAAGADSTRRAGA